jgi:hypothetical protein
LSGKIQEGAFFERDGQATVLLIEISKTRMPGNIRLVFILLHHKSGVPQGDLVYFLPMPGLKFIPPQKSFFNN